MKFVKTDDLKYGMRIARPIYNKKGVLLYERDSKLTDAAINSIKNFGLIGIFILEPAEPCPPMSEDDIEFERFQTVQVYAIEAELKEIIGSKRTKKIDNIVAAITKSYGHLSKKINFTQNLRSKEDFVYKHSLNVAILAAMMCHRMNVPVDEIEDIITAAIVHDIGKLMISDSLLREAKEEDLDSIYESGQVAGFEFIDQVFTNPNIRRICQQTQRALADLRDNNLSDNIKVVTGTKVLLVAEVFDAMTAMSNTEGPKSEVEALRFFAHNPEVFNKRAVEGLIDSINILGPGTCVELTSGEKALVISINPSDVLRPMVLMFSTNEIIDLSNRTLFDDIEIADIMKSMDNRYVMDQGAINDN
ncbi:MAG: HD domain-containing protein [Lachnospiraceae bacterium]|nr:HD domain-containing protein [Lachnospiraceae bacterium]